MPVWETPDIYITARFETKATIGFLESIKGAIPNPSLRCDYLDLYSECLKLLGYHAWTLDAWKATATSSDAEKVKFYGGHCNNIMEDMSLVRDEYNIECEE